MQMRLNKDRVYGDGYISAIDPFESESTSGHETHDRNGRYRFGLSALAKAGSLVSMLKAVKSCRSFPA
jgi:hypothetical protein